MRLTLPWLLIPRSFGRGRGYRHRNSWVSFKNCGAGASEVTVPHAQAVQQHARQEPASAIGQREGQACAWSWSRNATKAATNTSVDPFVSLKPGSPDSSINQHGARGPANCNSFAIAKINGRPEGRPLIAAGLCCAVTAASK